MSETWAQPLPPSTSQPPMWNIVNQGWHSHTDSIHTCLINTSHKMTSKCSYQTFYHTISTDVSQKIWYLHRQISYFEGEIADTHFTTGLISHSTCRYIDCWNTKHCINRQLLCIRWCVVVTPISTSPCKTFNSITAQSAVSLPSQQYHCPVSSITTFHLCCFVVM